MSNVYLMTDTEVKSYVPEINNSVASSLIYNAMLFSQETTIKNSLGQQWYDQIIGEKSGGTYSAANKVIVDNYIKQILSYSVWQYLIITLSLSLNEAGLRIKESDHSAAAESRDLAFMRDFIQNYIDNKRKEMFRYIEDHPTDYPYYYSNVYGDKPKNNIYNWRIGAI